MQLFESETAGDPQTLVYSASDLVTASECEYRTLHRLDEKLGRVAKPAIEEDAMLARASELGTAHEKKVLADLVARYGEWDPARGTGVVRIEAPAAGSYNPAGFAARHAETVAALRNGADVVFQATFFDGEFLGFADFVVKQPDGRYAVWDSKLARHAKVSALLQLAAYGDQLLEAGFEPHPQVTLVLGDMEESVHSLADLLPVYRERRDRFLQQVAEHRAAGSAVRWGEDCVSACGRCDYCAIQVAERRDLLLVAGMTVARRKKLIEDGIDTIDALAELDDSRAVGPLERMRDQARMQTGRGPVDGEAVAGKDDEQHPVAFRVLDDHTIDALPPASPGDIFFDFEGDPLWQDPANGSWGLEYLFGVVEADGQDPAFRPFWAHTRAEEKRAFLDFLDYVEDRRKTWPDLHVYHYAAYEKSALRNLSVRHTAGEDTVDNWLREGLLVDLYETVRHSLRISENSYSIKKLEPFYMGAEAPRTGVTDAGASVVAYAAYCAARDSGDSAEEAEVYASISAYNEYDCLSTLRLRDWLVGLAKLHPARAGGRDAGPDFGQSVGDGASGGGREPEEPTPEELKLRDFLDALPATGEATPLEQAVAMVAAATGYHRREDKQYWWDLFDSMDSLPDGLSERRNTFTVHTSAVRTDWHPPTTGKGKMQSRVVELTGTAAPASDFAEGTTWHQVLPGPAPETYGFPVSEKTGRYAVPGAVVVGVEQLPDAASSVDGDAYRILLREKETGKLPAGAQLPVALLPGPPIATVSLKASLAELARTVGGSLPSLPRDPGIDILLRHAPRLATLATLPPVETGPDGLGDYIGAITAAAADLDRSYLAVQGPPGTGKTHVGSHVIARLVERGWKVGVVSQGHAAVEHLLGKAVQAGVDPDVIAKEPKAGDKKPKSWNLTAKGAVPEALGRPGGCLVGGTAWTMTGAGVPPHSLDLLVIDEAGQFSLANTLAVARSARRLLLLGDPQQLPQVTQGTHPEPVDQSALGWLSRGHATLPGTLGYFLADSWRMHPTLCSRVSRLSYDGKLESAPAARLRELEGAPAGVETVMVEHTGRTTHSPEEAAEVVRQVRRHLGLAWNDGERTRPLVEADVMVVAAYNAQVNTVRAALEDAGLGGVGVGTVDKFQGQQAPVVILSMACSAASEAPRGMDFLLNRNRINVAVSRGQWRAVVVRSPALTHHMPTRPSGLEELGAFVGLCAAEPGPVASAAAPGAAWPSMAQ
ncbi:TM0106 family RecB-like putative nuclease [Arthrobacter sp. KK5.5]|uniref:TM0106 family RecB-like putative nuclease n=1 Tax=Arthrobacter sp. KK5.5 TaxID=3373084 RepID=UPI003EE5B5A3